MAGIKIPDLPSYGSIDTSKAKKDLLITTKNDGTYGTPTYPTNASKQLTVEELATMLPLPLNGNQFRLYNLGQTELVANTYNIIGNPATAPTVTTFTLPIVLPNKMLVAGVGATASPFIIEITGGYSGGSASNPITVQLTEVGDTVFFIGTEYGWQYVGSNKVTDLTGYATESYVDAKVEDTIVNGVTDKAPSQNAVFDAIAGIPTPTLATVTTAGNTTTNDVTVGSATVSNATVSTLPFIDSAKKIISATGSLLGTWFQTLTAKSTPVDADTIIVNDSASSFEAKKTTALQFWTNYIKPKADATYNAVFTISNNVWVDLNTTGLIGQIGRIDKPYSTVQSAYDAIISVGGTNKYLINVIGDFTFTSTMLTRGSIRANIDIVFIGNITSSIPSSGTSNGLIPGGWINSTITFNGGFTQTTNIGLGIGNLTNSIINFNGTTQLKQGKGAQDNYNIYGTSFLNSSINFKNLIFDFTNDSGLTPYSSSIITITGVNSNLFIDNLTIKGSSSISRSVQMVYGDINNMTINSIVFDTNINYNNVSSFILIRVNSINNLLINNVIQLTPAVAPTDLDNFNLMGVNTANNITVNNCNLTTTFGFGSISNCNNLQLGCITVSARTFGTITSSNLKINGFIKRTVTNSLFSSLLFVQGNTNIDGGIIQDSRIVAGGGHNGLIHYGNHDNTKTKTLTNCMIISANAVSPTTSKQIMGIEVYGNSSFPVRLILSNVSIIAPLNNTNNTTRPIDSYGGGGFYGVIDGNFRSNYSNMTLSEITINAEFDLIPNLQF